MDRPNTKPEKIESDSKEISSEGSVSSINSLDVQIDRMVSVASDKALTFEKSDSEKVTDISDKNIPALKFAAVEPLDVVSAKAQDSKSEPGFTLPEVVISNDSDKVATGETLDKLEVAESKEGKESAAMPVVKSPEMVVVNSGKVDVVEPGKQFVPVEIEKPTSTPEVENPADAKPVKVELPLALSQLGTEKANVYVDGSIITASDKSLKDYQLAMINERAQRDPGFDFMKVESTINFSRAIQSDSQLVKTTGATDSVPVGQTYSEIHINGAEETAESVLGRALQTVVKAKPELVVTGMKQEQVHKSLTDVQLAQIGDRVSRDPEFQADSVRTTVNLSALLNNDLVSVPDTRVGTDSKVAPVNVNPEGSKVLIAGQIVEIPAVQKAVTPLDTKVEDNMVAITTSEARPVAPVLSNLSAIIADSKREEAALIAKYEPAKPARTIELPLIAGQSPDAKTGGLALPVVKENITMVTTGRVEMADAVVAATPQKDAGFEFITHVRTSEIVDNKKLDLPGVEVKSFGETVIAPVARTRSENYYTANELDVLVALGHESSKYDAKGVQSRVEFQDFLSRNSITLAPPSERLVGASDRPVEGSFEPTPKQIAPEFFANLRAHENAENKRLDAGRPASAPIGEVVLDTKQHGGNTVTDLHIYTEEANVLANLVKAAPKYSTADLRSRDALTELLAVNNIHVTPVSSPIEVAVDRPSLPSDALPAIASDAHTKPVVAAFMQNVRDHEVADNKSLGTDLKPEVRRDIEAPVPVVASKVLTTQDFIALDQSKSNGVDIKTHDFATRADLERVVDSSPTLARAMANAYTAISIPVSNDSGEVRPNHLPTEASLARVLAVSDVASLPPVKSVDRAVVAVENATKPAAVDFIALVQDKYVANGGDISGDGSGTLPQVVRNAAAPMPVVQDRILTSQEFVAFEEAGRRGGAVDTTNFTSRKDLQEAVERNPVLASAITSAYTANTVNIGADSVVSVQPGHVPTGATLSRLLSGSNQNDSIGNNVNLVSNDKHQVIATQRDSADSLSSILANRVLVSSPTNDVAAKEVSKEQKGDSVPNYYARGGFSNLEAVDAPSRVVDSNRAIASLARSSAVPDFVYEFKVSGIKGNTVSETLNIKPPSSISISDSNNGIVNSLNTVAARSAGQFDYAVVKQVSDAYTNVDAIKTFAISNEARTQTKHVQTSQPGQNFELKPVALTMTESVSAKVSLASAQGKYDGMLTGSILDTTVRAQAGQHAVSGKSVSFTTNSIATASDPVFGNYEIKMSHVVGAVRADGRRHVASEANIGLGQAVKGEFTFGTAKGEVKSINITLDGLTNVSKIDLASGVKTASAHAATTAQGVNANIKIDIAQAAAAASKTDSTIKSDAIIKGDAQNNINNTITSVENIIQTAKTIVNHNTAPGLIAAVKNGEPLPEGMSYENGFIKLTHNGQVLYFPGLRAALKFVEGLGIDVNLDEEDDDEWYVQTLDSEGKSSRVQYIVVPGDTVESISETRLGDARYADLLITINRSEVVYRLDNGKKVPFVYPSQVLWLPSRYERKVFRKNFFKDGGVETVGTNCDTAQDSSSIGGDNVHKIAQRAISPEDILRKLHEEVVDHYAPKAVVNTEEKLKQSESGPLALMVDRVRFAGGRESVGLNEYPQSVGRLSKRTFHEVVEGDTILSIALKNPLMGDTRFWKLIAKVNGLTCRLDAFGNPLELLVPGQHLLMPDQKQIQEFALQEGVVKGNINSRPHSDTVITRELNVVAYSDKCRVSVIDFVNNQSSFSINLQIKLGNEWKTIATYQSQGGQAVRTTYANTGVTSSMVINLPAEIVKQMAYEDFNRNWKTRVKLYFSQDGVDTKNNFGEPPKPMVYAVS